MFRKEFKTKNKEILVSGYNRKILPGWHEFEIHKRPHWFTIKTTKYLFTVNYQDKTGGTK